MKWLAVIVVALVAGAVAVFAIYTWGWRDTEAPNVEADRARAQLVANRLGEVVCDGCRPTSLIQVAGSVWKIKLGDDCYLIDTEEFAARSTGYDGFSGTNC